MSEVVDCIEFLERLGAKGGLHESESSSLEGLLAQTGLDSDLRAAIVAADGGLLGRLLGARANVCCLVEPGPPEDDDDDDEDESDDEDADEELDDEGRSSRSRAVRPIVDAA